MLAINGQSVAHLRRVKAAARLDWQPGTVTILRVRAPGREPVDLELRSELVSMPVTTLLPGSVGLSGMDGFTDSPADAAALLGFEQAEALGWIIDMPGTCGGVSSQLSHLLVNEGRLFSRQRHDEVHLADGAVLAKRHDVDLDGTSLPVRRPW